MEKDGDVKFYCPRCNKPGSVHETLQNRNYAIQALRLPYFLCGECRLIFISKRLVIKTISEWRNRNQGLKKFLSYISIRKRPNT